MTGRRSKQKSVTVCSSTLKKHSSATAHPGIYLPRPPYPPPKPPPPLGPPRPLPRPLAAENEIKKVSKL